MKAIYYQNGDTIDFVNSTKDLIEANSVVVIGKKVGVAGAPILPDAIGVLHMVGVFKMTKVEADDIAVGDSVYFTGEAITVTETGHTLAGYAVKAAGAGVTEVYVKLQG
ncbi:capsid cement protein [Clostridium saccharoperbutylacetonicum]